MPDGLSRKLRIHPDLAGLSEAAAESVVQLAAEAVSQRGRFAMALSGGSTPRELYRLLADRHREAMPWAQVHVFWGDERYVPDNDPASNYRMAREALLDHVPVPVANWHPMPTEAPDPELSAQAYEAALRGEFADEWPRFDLVLLGMGADGHTASLFPGSPALRERERWVVTAEAATGPRVRLTLTLPALNHAAAVYFLVAGAEKAAAVARALAETPDAAACPASAVRPVDGELVWWLDEAAAGPISTRQ